MSLDPDEMDNLTWYDVVLAKKSQCKTMRLLRFFLGEDFDNYWTTFRWPLCRAVIAYPDNVQEPEKHTAIVRHELFHVKQFAPWYGPVVMFLLVTVFPLPALFSGRWFVERGPYLDEIKQGLLTVDEAVEILWSSYGAAWPRPLMRKWFNKQLGVASAGAS